MAADSTPNERLAKAGEIGRLWILKAKPSDLGLQLSPDESPVWGVVMDIPFPNAVVTLVALQDGKTSLYFQPGGAIIGGEQHAPLAQAAKSWVAAAQRFYSRWEPTDAFPLPAPGKVRFYLLTSDGVRTVEAVGQELGDGHHELAPLFKMGDEVLTALRLLCTPPQEQALRLELRDNLMQAIIIAVSIGLGVAIGGLLAPERLPGLLMGGFLGLVAGFFVSGILLMLMRAVRRRRQSRR